MNKINTCPSSMPEIETRKRNVWNPEEVPLFLHMIKQNHALTLMDGKRLRVKEIFKSLLPEMTTAGFIRDVPQLIVK